MVNSQSKSSLPPQTPQNAVVNSTSLTTNETSWTVADSAELYNIQGWGEPYFGINSQGNVTVSVPNQPDNEIDLVKLIATLNCDRISSPLLIRFPDILGDRMARLQECMAKAIARYGYDGKYQGVFPIKCNQNRHFIEDVVRYGKSYQLGLEAGSKAELAIALASLDTMEITPSLLMCNGYKDREYIETALLAKKLGQKPIMIVEQLPELKLILEISQELDIKPILGIRAKLDTKGIGRWENSTGDRAKFGLTIAEILQTVEVLASTNRLDYLQLLHFHIGSQISAIKVIKNAIREASQIYVQLVKLGANMQYLNVGGGLAVDYDGSKTNFAASKNYSMQNYANDVVAQVRDACTQANVAVPTLISESGRAIAAHQSVLIFDVLSTSSSPAMDVGEPAADAPLVIRNFWETYSLVDKTNLQESYHDAIQFKQEALSLFNFGYLSLAERAYVEKLYRACCAKIFAAVDNCDDVGDDLRDLAQIMAVTYYINLSIFKSVPDTWAIEQLFPIMPLQRLQEQPTVKANLADITCDSDGKVDRFIDRQGFKNLLDVHSLNQDDTPYYYLGIFLVGAYQEIMGNLHNLFGKTNVVQIKFTSSGYKVDAVIKGDSIKEVLGYVQYDPENLLKTMRHRTETALQNQTINKKEAAKLLKNYKHSLEKYTYLS